MGGSSKKVTVGYKYYAGMHMVLHHGSADKMLRVRVDDRDVILDVLPDTSVNLNKPSLFGGESREGGIQGQMDFETGKPAQPVNAYLASKLGEFVSAFRGVTAVVLRQMYLGLNPYLKPWSFRIQRIHKRFDNQTQWYDAKSEIVTTAAAGGTYTLPSTSAHQTPGYNTFEAKVTLEAGETMLVQMLGSALSAYSLWASDSEVPPGRKPWRYTLNVSKNGAAPTPYYPTEYDTPEEAAQAAASIGPITLVGPGTFSVYLWDGDTEAYDNRGSASFTIGRFGASDMNPAHIIRECLTDPDWGMGYQDADIDDASFMSAADTLFAEGMGISILWDTQTSIEEFVKEIIKHIDAALFVDRKTGKFTLKLVRADYDESSLIVLDESNIDKITDFKRPTFGELVNSVTVTYWDWQTGKDSTITISDIALAQQQQNNNLVSLKYQGFTNGLIASRVAQRDLKQLSTPLVTCTIYTNRVADELNIGSVFKLTWPDYELHNLVMRVTGIAYGDGKSNRIRIQCAQDVFALPDTAVIPDAPPIWEDPGTFPVPVSKQIAFEVPYLELVQVQGQTQTDSLLSANPNVGYVGAAAVRPANSVMYCRLFTDNGAGFEEAGQVDFSPSAVLSEDISRIQETFDVEDRQDFEEIVLGSWFQIGTEIMGYLGISGNTITVQRGCLDTVPVEHWAGDTLVFWDYYAEADPTEYVESDSVLVKLPTVSGGGQLLLEDASSLNVVLGSRAARPYAPGDFKINGLYFPETVLDSSNLLLSWSHRNRLQQTSAELIDFFEGNIGPEAGTTYEINFYNENGALVKTETAISGTSFEWITEEADSGLPVETSTFTPSSLFSSGEKGFWLDASDFTTMFQDTAGTLPVTAIGQSVKLIRDKSGNGNHFTQANNAPTLQKDAIGNYYLDFNGTSQFLTRTGDAALRIGTNSISYCIGAKYNTVSGFSVIQSPISRSFAGSLPGRYWNGLEPATNQHSTYQAGASVSQASASTKPTAITVISGLINRNTGTNLLRFDGTQVGSASFASDSATNYTNDLPTRLGAYNSTNSAAGDSGSNFFNGRIYQAVVVYRNLSSGELISLEDYISSKSQQAPGSAGYRKNGKIRVTLESLRDGMRSFQKHDYTLERTGYGFNYGKRYGE